MDLKELFPAFSAATQAMESVYAAPLQEHSSRFGLTTRDVSILMCVPTFEPRPVSAAILNIRSPYTAPEFYQAILRKLSGSGMLRSNGVDQYQITSVGLETLKEIKGAVYNAMAGIQSLSVTKQMDLASRLKELSDACLATSDPPGTWCIQHERCLDPGSKAPMMARIDQFFSELRSFRDDAHLAAWRVYEKNGHAWEILTYLWISKEGLPESINQALSRRGNSLEKTMEAVDALVRKGWVSQENNLLRITPFGKEIRKTAEDTTDRFYLEPFKRFSDAYLSETLELVEEHRRGLKFS